MKPCHQRKIPHSLGVAKAALIGLMASAIFSSGLPVEAADVRGKVVRPQKNKTATRSKRSKPGRRPASVTFRATGQINRGLFLAAARAELDQSLAKTRQTLTARRAEISNLVAGAYDPWSFSLTSKREEYSLISGYSETSAVGALRYSSPGGFSFQSFGDYFEPSDWGALSARSSVVNYGVTLSQEVISGWSRSQFYRDREAVAVEGRAQVASAEATFLSQVLSIVDSANSLFSAKCRLRDLKQLTAFTEKSLAISEVQRAARTISTRDQLRIAEAHLNVERQVLATEFEIESLTNTFAAVSETAAKMIRGLSDDRIDCESEVESLSQVPFVPKAEMHALARRHPSVFSLELQRQAIKERTESYHSQRRPSLKLLGGYTRIEDRTPSKPYDDYYVGIEFTYQFRDDQYDSRLAALNHDARTLLVNEKQAALDLEGFLGRMYAQLDYLLKQVPVAEKSLGNTRRILKIIQTQQAIGELDATALESAYTTYMSSVSSARELWAQTVSLTQKLEEIRASIQRLEAN